MFYNRPICYSSPARSFWNGSLSIDFPQFEPLHDSVLRIFDDQLETYSRRFEATEKDGVLTYTLVLPGFKQADVNVEIEKEILTVLASRGDNQIEQSVHVGPDIDLDKAEAKLEDGILSVSLSKLAAAKPRKVVVK